MKLYKFILSHQPVRPHLLLGLCAAASLSTVLVLAAVSSAAEVASKGQVSAGWAAVFLVSTLCYALAQRKLGSTITRTVEGTIGQIRLDLFSKLTKVEPAFFVNSPRPLVFGAMTDATAALSRSLPMIIMGLQQAILLVLVGVYMTILSPGSFIFIGASSLAIVTLYLKRMKQYSARTAAVEQEERKIIDALHEITLTLRELRLSRRKSEEAISSVTEISRVTRDNKTELKRQSAHDMVLVQGALLGLIGVTVFVVPMFASGFKDVAFSGLTGALFLVGPIGAVASAIPVTDDAERALATLADLDERLGGSQTVNPQQPEPAPSGTFTPQVVTVDKLTHTHFSESGLPAFTLGPIDMEFGRSEITFITGGNGSGKSTLLHILVGLLQAQAGSISINGTRLQADHLQRWRNTISVVFADGHLFAPLYGIDEEDLVKAHALLARFELAHKVAVENGCFSTIDLSAGQRRRLSLVSALLEDKPVVVLDEWAADQDPHFRKMFYEELLPELRAQQKIIICVTHDDRWFNIADKVWRMAEGRIQRQG